MKYYLIAGEASGDLHASNLMASIKQEDSSADFRFFGGDKMARVGGTLVKHYRELAYMGFIPVLLHAKTILNNMKMCKRDIENWNPDVVILVDYPGFNLDIAKFVHKRKIAKVFYYISPKIWAWKEYRIKNIRRDVDELFSILPFEVEWFRKRNYDVHYVGNPCVDAIHNTLHSKPSNSSIPSPQIAILSGSRKQEIKDNLTKMLQAASRFKDYELVLAAAPGIDREYYNTFIPEGINLKIVSDKTYEVLNSSTAALVTSGTATLETAIIGTPQVVCYAMRPARLFGFLRRHFLNVKFVSLVNLVCGREVVKELVADDMTVDNIIDELTRILPGGVGRDKMLSDYKEMNQILGGPGASRRAAKEIVEALSNSLHRD